MTNYHETYIYYAGVARYLISGYGVSEKEPFERFSAMAEYMPEAMNERLYSFLTHYDYSFQKDIIKTTPVVVPAGDTWKRPPALFLNLCKAGKGGSVNWMFYHTNDWLYDKPLEADERAAAIDQEPFEDITLEEMEHLRASPAVGSLKIVWDEAKRAEVEVKKTHILAGRTARRERGEATKEDEEQISIAIPDFNNPTLNPVIQEAVVPHIGDRSLELATSFIRSNNDAFKKVNKRLHNSSAEKSVDILQEYSQAYRKALETMTTVKPKTDVFA